MNTNNALEQFALSKIAPAELNGAGQIAEMARLDMSVEDIAENVTPLKPNQRLPTPEEIRDMRNCALKYRRDNPRATQRQVERHVCKKFNLKLID